MKQAEEDIVLLTEHIHWLASDRAWHYRVLPKDRSDSHYTLYYEAGTDAYSLATELEVLFGSEIQLHAIPAPQVAKLLSKYYRKESSNQSSKTLQVSKNPDDFLNNLIAEARQLKSSDIHIETYEQKCRVRIRVDGMLIERHLLDRNDYPALISKIKIISNLDIAEKTTAPGRAHQF